MGKRILILSVVLATVGCGKAYVEEPPWPAPTPLARVDRTGDKPYQSTSLWTENAPLGGSYMDIRARKVGDLVTVVVVESSEASREATTDVSRDTGVNAGVSAFLGAPTHYGLPDLYKSGGFDPSVRASTANSFKGAGTTTRKDQLRTQVSARVVNILEDGNLILEGRRQVKVNEETQYLFVRGIARIEDISPDNTIASAALADAQILYGGHGLIARQQEPGWMYTILDAVWPF